MEALDLLEKRIDSLSRMLGPVPDVAANSASTSADTGTVVDALQSAHTLLNGAISGHEQITKAIERSEELEKYLEPNFLEDNQQVRSKEVYLNAVAPDVYAQCQQLERIKQLEPTLGAEYFRNIPGECNDKLKQVTQDNAEFTQQSELIEESLILAMKRYGEIQTGLLESLDKMGKRLEAVEEKMLQKKRDDQDKHIPMPGEEVKGEEKQQK